MSNRMRQIILHSVDHQTCTSSGQHDLCRRRVAVSCNVSLLKWKIKKKKEKKSVGRGIAYLVPGDIKASNELLFLSS